MGEKKEDSGDAKERMKEGTNEREDKSERQDGKKRWRPNGR